MHETREGWRLGHRPALDGLRGVAILLVVACHAYPDLVVRAGSVGVQMFFALSGFLITSLLIEERTRRHRVSLRGFYRRRAYRLGPALLVYLTFWSVLSIAGVGPYAIAPGEVILALLYATNWTMAAGASLSHPIAITWSLSVEEQFYLLWPLTFLAARRCPQLPWIAATAVVASSLVAYSGAMSGAWTMPRILTAVGLHFVLLLAGALVSLAIHRYGRVPAVCRHLAWPAVGALVALLVFGANPLLHTVAVSAATLAIIAATLTGGGRWLSSGVLRYFGRRSYALYLWHYPLTVMAWDRNTVWWFTPLLVAVSLAAAEASWWLVERPARRLRDRSIRAVEAPSLLSGGRRPKSPGT